MRNLYLNGNQLEGEIPAELGNLMSLRRVDLGTNQLAAPIPPTVGGLVNLVFLRLSNNQLTGGIPTELGGLINLRYLHLAHNQLTGHIPLELGNLANLSELRLSGNQLSGCIPSQLQHVNVSDLVELALPFCASPALTTGRITLSDVDNTRGYVLTVVGSGFSHGTSAAVYVLYTVHAPDSCQQVVNDGTRVGSSIVGTDGRVAVTFAVTSAYPSA